MPDIIIRESSEIYKMLLQKAKPFETADELLNRLVDSYKATPPPNSKPTIEKSAITTEMVKEFYTKAKAVYEGRISLHEALDQLENISRRATANVYFHVFIAMREGKRYTRTINMSATKYFLNQIFTDYGSEGLKTALHALDSHMEYFEGFIGGGNMKNMRRMRNGFAK